MTEQERVDKLKARMSRWQAYVDKPQADTVQHAEEATELPVEIHQVRAAVRTSERPTQGVMQEYVRRKPPGRGNAQIHAPAVETVTDLQEARIAELQHAIAREREQADRLAEEVRRAQNLHAATLYSHLAEEKVRTVETRPAPFQIPDVPPVYYYEERRKGMAILLGVLLVITSVCIATFFLTR
jgi:hypothetical protein